MLAGASRDVHLVGEPHRDGAHDRDGVADCAGVGGGDAADAQIEALARWHYNGSLHAQPHVMQLVRPGEGLGSTAPICSDLLEGRGSKHVTGNSARGKYIIYNRG